MYSCILCDNQEEWTMSLCSKCIEIKRIMDIYGVDKVKESLTYIFVRDDTPIKNRTECASAIKEKK